MNRIGIRKRVLDELLVLSPQDQEKVLRYAVSLSGGRVTGHPGADLLRFSGMIEKRDLEAMELAIEESCEVVDVDEW